MKDLSSESSLDRFLENRAGILLGQTTVRQQVWLMRLVALFAGSIGATLVAVGAATHNPGMAAGSFGPLLAGGVNFALSTAIARRPTRTMETDVKLSSEARKFLSDLMQDVMGWHYRWGEHEATLGSPYRRRWRRRERLMWARSLMRADWGSAQKPSAQALPDALFKVLDGAAQQYNRVFAVLGSAVVAPNPTILKMESAVRRGADEAMSEILHQAFLLREYPEGGAAAQHRIEAQTKALEELADRLEQVQTRPATLTDKLNSSTIDTVLEELRLDQLARSELTEKPSTEAQEENA